MYSVSKFILLSVICTATIDVQFLRYENGYKLLAICDLWCEQSGGFPYNMSRKDNR